MHIEIQLLLFLIVYLAMIFVSILYLIFIFYHLFRFGSLDVETVFYSFFFFAIFILILFASYQQIIKVNWRQSLVAFDLPNIPKVNIELPPILKDLKNFNFNTKIIDTEIFNSPTK